MKPALLILAFFACACFEMQAQTFKVDTVFKNGKLSERINLVFVGDGYKADEQDDYLNDVNDILDEVFNQSPFKEYKSYFNAFAIEVISNQSGANHPKTSLDSDCVGVPQMVVDNYFGSTFDVVNIHRLLAPTKYDLLGDVLAEYLPVYDQAFVVVNSDFYGGSGGFFATGSVHPSGKEVAIHEIGHSFGALADEYWAGPQYAAEMANMTAQSNASLVKWKNWIGVDGIGIYPHTESPTWKRPHQNCKMRLLGVPFCRVCTEAFVEKIHGFVDPLVSYAPVATTMPLPNTETIDFSLTTVKPAPNTMKVTWEKDNHFFSKNVDMISLPVSSLGGGALIRATVVDTTQLTRSPNHETHHVYVVEWKVGDVIVTDIPITSVESKYVVSVFPNPVDEHLSISYTLYKPTTVQVTLLDINGRKASTLVRASQAAGEHHYEFDNIPVPRGEYLLKFEFDGASFVRKLIRQ